MMTGRCFIFGALEVRTLRERPDEGDFVIAADRGWQTAMSLGIVPDLAVGDFDSLGVSPEGVPTVRLQVRKDDTDLEHAVNIALERGYTDFVVYGAVGGALDHTLGNIAVAEMIADRGGRSVFRGEQGSFSVIRGGSLTLPARDSGRAAVISLSEISRGVSISGLSYEADGIDLPRATTRGIGNSFIGKEAGISVADGTLLVIF